MPHIFFLWKAKLDFIAQKLAYVFLKFVYKIKTENNFLGLKENFQKKKSPNQGEISFLIFLILGFISFFASKQGSFCQDPITRFRRRRRHRYTWFVTEWLHPRAKMMESFHYEKYLNSTTGLSSILFDKSIYTQHIKLPNIYIMP